MPIELKKLQDMVYSIFKEFDRICTQNDIHYSMEGGTLLGAVKYGDFVPWDDDIDVVMERSQYEKFLQIAPAQLDGRFFLQSYHNVPEFPLNYAKLCLNGTEIYNYDYSHLKNMHHGVFMDIFPIDEVKPAKLRSHCSRVGVLTGARKTKLRAIKPRGIRKVVYGILSRLPQKTLNNLVTKSCKKYHGKKTGYLYEVCNANGNFPAMPRRIYDETVRLPFRDGMYEASAHYDEFLKSRFGAQYMSTLPPEEARKPSHNQNIRILEGYDFQNI